MNDRTFSITQLGLAVVAAVVITAVAMRVLPPTTGEPTGLAPQAMVPAPEVPGNVPQSAAGPEEPEPTLVVGGEAPAEEAGALIQPAVVSEPQMLAQDEAAALEIPPADDIGIEVAEPAPDKPEAEPPPDTVDVAVAASEIDFDYAAPRPPESEAEPEAAPSESEALGTSRAVVYGTISPPWEEDHWLFSANSGDLVTIAMDRIGGSLDSYLVMYDPSGRYVTHDDDGGGNQNSRIYRQRTNRSGQFRVVAKSYNQGSSGSYRLTLTIETSDRGYPGPTSNVAVEQVWTADRYGRARNRFGPGDTIRYYARIKNSGTRPETARVTFNESWQDGILFIPPPPIWRGNLQVPAGTSLFYVEKTFGQIGLLWGRWDYSVEVVHRGRVSKRTYRYEFRW